VDATWAERIDLFRYALSSALLAGAICPLLGAFLLVRRTSFYGIALPQFATAGMVLGFVVLPWWVAHVGLGGLDVDTALTDSHAAMNYHLAWAALATFVGLGALLLAGRAGGGGASEIGRVAAAFAIANAATFLFGRVSPIGRAFVDELFSGEVLTVGVHEFETLAVLLALVLLSIAWFHRDLVLVSFDRETALVLGKRVLAFEALLTLLTGVTVAGGTLTLGPTLLFGLLVLPPLAARAFARSMREMLLLSAALGLAAALGGSAASFALDLPLGPAIVGIAALELLPGAVLRRVRAARA
jgi:ABC-type Mn2+/Zn2+ transport system permease subunit